MRGSLCDQRAAARTLREHLLARRWGSASAPHGYWEDRWAEGASQLRRRVIVHDIADPVGPGAIDTGELGEAEKQLERGAM